MAAYLFGQTVEGDYKAFNLLDANEVKEIKNSDVVIIVNSALDTKLYNCYVNLKTLFKNNNKVVLVLNEDDKSSIKQPLCMLAVMYGCYNIYSCEVGDITNENIQAYLAREASEVEVTEYVGNNLDSFDRTSEMMLKIKDFLDSNNISGLTDYIADNKDSLQSIPSIIDFLKKIMDSHIRNTDVRVEKLKSLLDETTKKYNDLKTSAKDALIKVKSLEEDLKTTKTRSNDMEKQIETLNRQKKTLEEQLASSAADDDFDNTNGVMKYKTLDIGQFRTLNTYFIYFKEISRVTHAKSMLINLSKYLGFAGKKVRLAIYDKPHDFMSAYTDVTIINGEKYSRDPNILKVNTLNGSKDILLITDTNMAITSSLVKSECDIIIIFDRLKFKEDLIEGTLVNKFYLAGDTKTIKSVESATGIRFPSERTFINEPSDKWLSIPEIKDFNKQMDVSKITKYSAVVMPYKDGKHALFSYIEEVCGLNG